MAWTVIKKAGTDKGYDYLAFTAVGPRRNYRVYMGTGIKRRVQRTWRDYVKLLWDGGSRIMVQFVGKDEPEARSVRVKSLFSLPAAMVDPYWPKGRTHVRIMVSLDKGNLVFDLKDLRNGV